MKPYKLICQSTLVLTSTLSLLTLVGCSESPLLNGLTDITPSIVPADVIDLSHWNITVPIDLDNSDKADTISVTEIKNYQLDNFFYVDENNQVVFATPNKAITTATSTNTRSELRQMLRGSNTDIDTKSPKNNFALAAHPKASSYASIGSRMEATLKVNHVSLNAKHGDKPPAYSVVVGQIHAGKDEQLKAENNGFGWGNEPLKIFYKKWPNHETGSVFWNYERNLTKEDPNRTDIDYAVWGHGWDSPNDPGEKGIKLGEEFSYEVNVVDNIMYLKFYSKNHPTVKHQINLANNIDANGEADELDHPQGYAGDWMYFKAGAYNQCSTKDDPSFRYPACPGTGDWETDKADGNYTSVSFSRIVLSDPIPVK